MAIRGILNTARSLGYWLRSQEVTANNLANANTDAFKVDRITARQLPGEPSRNPAGASAPICGRARCARRARPLDLALDGEGLLRGRDARRASA